MRTRWCVYVLLLLCGCGGSSGSAPAPGAGALLVGDYAWASMSARTGVVQDASTTWATANADGAETLNFDMFTQNGSGTLLGPLPGIAVRYGVGLDRALGLRSTAFPLLDASSGGVTADGAVAALGNNLLDTPTIQFLTRVEGTWSEASLSGQYHIGGYSYDYLLDIHSSWFGVVTFDGAGGASISAGINRNGVVIPFGPTPFTYSVAADGRTTINLTTALTLTGQIAPDGDLLIVSGSTQAGGFPGLFAFLRVGSGLTNAVLDGTYHTVGLSRDVGASIQRGVVGATVADNGSVEWFLRRFESEDQIDITGDLGTYTVVGNGTLVVTTSSDQLRGAVTPDGRFAFLTRGTVANLDPTFWFLLR